MLSRFPLKAMQKKKERQQQPYLSDFF